MGKEVPEVQAKQTIGGICCAYLLEKETLLAVLRVPISGIVKTKGEN